MWTWIEKWDLKTTRRISDMWSRSIWLNAAMIVCAKYTPIMMLAILVIAASGIALQPDSLRNADWSVTASIVAAIAIRVLHEPITRLVSRPRPFDAEPFEPLLTHDSGDSFPSNHAAGAMALAFGSIHLSGVNVILVVLGLWLCIARIYCGLHHMSDVLAGASGGMAVGSVFAYLQWIFHLA